MVSCCKSGCESRKILIYLQLVACSAPPGSTWEQRCWCRWRSNSCTYFCAVARMARLIPRTRYVLIVADAVLLLPQHALQVVVWRQAVCWSHQASAVPGISTPASPREKLCTVWVLGLVWFAFSLSDVLWNLYELSCLRLARWSFQTIFVFHISNCSLQVS